MTPRPRRRLLWAAAAFSVLLFIAVVEAVMYPYVWFKYGMLPHQVAKRDFYPYEHHYMEDHPYLPYIAMPGRYGNMEFNSHGDRGPELDEPKTRVRILCYGGSSTFDASHEWDKTWPGRLQALLGPKYEVVNAAQNGATTADTLVNYGLIHSHHQADYVLGYDGNNDLESSFCADIKADYSHRRRKISHNVSPFVRALPRWLDWSAGYVAFRSIATPPLSDLHTLYTRPCKKPDLAGGPFGVPLFKRNLVNLGALAKANGATLVVGTFQFHKPWAQRRMGREFADAWERGTRLENEVIRALPKTHPSIAVAEVEKSFTPTDETMFDFVHLTEAGNDAVARAFHREVTRLEAARRR